jgi:tRNA pseudouridine38-40 synthase
MTSSRTLRMTLSYDGTNYCGWQVQPNGVSLQEVVERGLSQFACEPIRVVASGRTDAGVHAVGQVISFETTSTAPCRAFVQGLPIHLPDDIVVRDAVEVAAGFNARFDAKSKWYRYVIHNSVTRTPFLHTKACWQRSHLNDQAMHEAAEVLLGTHDFRCFETNWPNRSSSVRTLFRSQVTRLAGWELWEGDRKPGQLASPAASLAPDLPFVCFDVEADGFLYNMVRAIVGTLIHVGRGRWTAEDMRQIVQSGDRALAGETAPAHGLYLMHVNYDEVPTVQERALKHAP